MSAESYSVTLAAGAGSRMPADMPPKTCCRIGPVSIIENALAVYEQAGVFRHVVVVGQRAAEVMAEVKRTRRDVLFAFQERPRGTGDAVRCALDLLAAIGPPEHVLISAGDKVVAPHVIRGLLEGYAGADADMFMAVGASEYHPGSGRVIVRDGLARAIIEMPDIHVHELAAELCDMPAGRRPRTVGELAALASLHVPRPEKLAAYFPALGALLAGEPDAELSWEDVLAAAATVPAGFDRAVGRIAREEAVAADLCNLSVYVGAFPVLHDVVGRLGKNNVQGECYFTDAVEVLASEGRSVGLFRVGDPQDVMAFNTVVQLEEVRHVHAVRAQERRRYPALAQWSTYLSGDDHGAACPRAVEGLIGKVGAEREGIVVRSPGRINLMGRHVDHQGGVCNLMAIDREIAIVASPRDDDRINLWNEDGRAYPDRSFTIGELTQDIVWENWLRTLDSQFLQRMVSDSAGDWANYVKGAALRIQHRFVNRPLRGIDAFVVGDIPVAAGLSSSSALVVGVAEALAELNALNIRPKEFVDLCGEGEWFVGTRGGSADHAAIKFGRKGEVVSVSFFPFEVVGQHPFPQNCSLIVCHSGLSARKTENARERFNSRVACYHMARELIRRRFPEFAPLIAHLRDVNTERLDITLPALYGLLKSVPTSLDAAGARELAEAHETVEKCLVGLDLAAQDFPVRDVALFGLAECARSRRAATVLQQGDARHLGAMMNISHDGDRVCTWRPEREPYASRADEETMDGLARRAASLRGVTAAGAALWQQPGAYDCSTPEIDLMVDRVLACPGVLGAQLAGAGLGGCIMVLVREGSEADVERTLLRDYYEPCGTEPRTFVCHPSRGSQVLTSVESAG